MYRRAGAGGDSSAFEHVFLGEIDHNQAKGKPRCLHSNNFAPFLILTCDHLDLAFHNWINFYVCEQNGTMKYEGIVPERGSRRSEQVGICWIASRTL